MKTGFVAQALQAVRGAARAAAQHAFLSGQLAFPWQNAGR
jgi:hypothetical protein